MSHFCAPTQVGLRILNKSIKIITLIVESKRRGGVFTVATLGRVTKRSFDFLKSILRSWNEIKSEIEGHRHPHLICSGQGVALSTSEPSLPGLCSHPVKWSDKLLDLHEISSCEIHLPSGCCLFLLPT